MLLASKVHTAGNTKRWRINYSRWLENTVDIASAVVTSSSATCTVADNTVLGDDVIFFLTGGTRGESVTVSVAVTDTNGNVKKDTIMFNVVAP
jgi:hypothetical protein